jgi:hypothetical protein
VKERSFRYFVKPLTPNAVEQIAAYLNDLGYSAQTLEAKDFKVGNTWVKGAYVVPHNIVTEISRSVHRDKVRVYVQEGSGKVRLFRLYTRRQGTIASSPEAKRIAAELKKRKNEE